MVTGWPAGGRESQRDEDAEYEFPGYPPPGGLTGAVTRTTAQTLRAAARPIDPARTRGRKRWETMNSKSKKGGGGVMLGIAGSSIP